MFKLIKKFFNHSKNDLFKKNTLDIQKNFPVKKIFDAIKSFSDESDIYYVGGCVRKILNQEEVDDIDLAVNLNPNEVKECLQSNNIKFFETGIEHGTITANLGKKNFEITSLREDVDTDGRHARVVFSENWNSGESMFDNYAGGFINGVTIAYSCYIWPRNHGLVSYGVSEFYDVLDEDTLFFVYGCTCCRLFS